MNLDKIFNPKTIAVIGASSKKNAVGYTLFNNLIKNGYKREIFPVNVKYKKIQGRKSYKSIKKISKKIDLVIIATPALTVSSIIDECGDSGVEAVIIISAGFNEIGKQGEKISNEIKEKAKKYKMRILGPNCLGLIRPSIKLNASFASKTPLPGKIAFISQSGALCTAILDWSLKNNVGFSYFVSVGSMIDISFHDLIDYFGHDPNVSSILIYMESLTDARKFLSAARAFSKTKPIIVLKSGRSNYGAKAAKSHTGSLAGDDVIFSTAFERAGIVRVSTIVELFHTAKCLAMQPLPSGNNMAVITNAGGPGVIAADVLYYSKGKIAKLQKKTIDKLDTFLPSAWSKGNPIDILGDADPEKYKKTIEVCLDDKNIDAILVILTPQSMINPEKTAQLIISIKNKIKKPIFASWMGGESVASGRKILEKGHIPIYRQPEDAVRSFINVYNYSKNLKLLYETPATIPHAFSPKVEESKQIICTAIKNNRNELNEKEVKQLLKNYEIPVLESVVLINLKDIVLKLSKINFPVAMKILSPDIIHKTDIGGVELNVEKKDVKKIFNKIINSVKKHKPKAKIDGVLIEPMINKKYELIIGSKKDLIFGPVIVFGMGGVSVEVFKDIVFGLPPLNMALSLRMIKKTKIYRLLKGYRGMKGVDIQTIQFLLYKFSYLIADFPEIKELDINPFAIDEFGGVVLDAKAILDKDFINKKDKLNSQLAISPYPKKYIRDFTFKNGKKAIIRPIKPEDEPMEIQMFKEFSLKTQKHRFFREIKDITHEMMQRYTQIDYDREIALIAEIDENNKKKMVGVARLKTDPYNQTAEFAVVIVDKWQFKGLGNQFTDYILQIARERNIKKIYAKFLKENKPMISIFKKRNFQLTKLEKDKIFAELNLN